MGTKIKKCVGTFHTFLPLAVGADLCVRPAETLYGSLPFFGEFVMPTTGGHIGQCGQCHELKDLAEWGKTGRNTRNIGIHGDIREIFFEPPE